MYQPAEDSFILETHSEKLSKGKVLDVGTGIGVQAIAATRNNKVDEVLAVDIDKEAIAYCKRNVKNKRIKFMVSDLFENLKGKFDMSEIKKISEHDQKPMVFDTIIFNPPYLPEEKDLKTKDKALYGGNQGYELIEKFMKEADNHLKEKGKILMVFSSITGKKKVDEIIKKECFKAKLLDTRHIFFEDLFVYEIKK